MKLIGFAILWWLGWVLIGMIINSIRARRNRESGVGINDGVTGFLIGLSIGPMALLPPFDDKTLGGLVGSVLFILLYLNF